METLDLRVRIARMLGWEEKDVDYGLPDHFEGMHGHTAWFDQNGNDQSCAFHTDFNQLMQAVDFLSKEIAPYSYGSDKDMVEARFTDPSGETIAHSIGTDPLKVIFEAVCKVVEAKKLGMEGGKDG